MSIRKKVAIIHTSLVSVNDLKVLFGKIIPEAKVYNIVDDSLLQEVMENGGINSGIIKRMTNYFQMAESLGVNAIFSQCSSVGEAADIAGLTIQIPVLKIDQAMADKAVSIGRKIALVATVASTINPSRNLIEASANNMAKNVEITEVLVDGALSVLINEGNRQKHNKMVLEKIQEIDGHCDVIVLAQGSMASLLPELKHIKTPILTSPESGVRKMRQMLNLS